MLLNGETRLRSSFKRSNAANSAANDDTTQDIPSFSNSKRTKFLAQQPDDDFTQNPIYSRPRLERSPNSKGLRSEIAADSTEVLFPTSVADTKSSFGPNSDFLNGNVRQRFMFDENAPVTSPPLFKDSYEHSSPSIQLFRPNESTKQISIVDTGFEQFETPTIKDLIDIYVNMEAQDTQQTVNNNLELYFSSLAYIEPPKFQNLFFNFMFSDTIRNIKSISQSLQEKNDNFNTQITEISEELQKNPPQTLRTLNKLQVSEINQIITRSNSLMTLFNVQATNFVLSQILELENSYSNYITALKNLQNIYHSGEKFLKTDPTIAKIQELEDIRQKIREEEKECGDIQTRINNFTSLQQSLPFSIKSIKNGIASITTPQNRFVNVSTSGNSISTLYSDISFHSRKTSLEIEIATLAASVPNVSMRIENGQIFVDMTFSRASESDFMRFKLQFVVSQKLYPWVQFELGVNVGLQVLAGNKDRIAEQIAKIVADTGMCKKPLLSIAQRICNAYILEFKK